MTMVTLTYKQTADTTELTCNELGVIFRLAKPMNSYGICKSRIIGKNVTLTINANVTKEQVQQAINEELNPDVVKLA